MNPSASGWIPKFLARFESSQLIEDFDNETAFYGALKSCGFIYGVSVQSILDEKLSDLSLTQEEFTKVHLFHALLYTFFKNTKAPTNETAVSEIISFYKSIEKGKTGFLQKLRLSKSPTSDLEKILSARLQENNTLLKNKSTSLLTAALLYLDVLDFKAYLKNQDGLQRYSDSMQNALVTCCLLALEAKERKNKYDDQLLELVRSSSEFFQHKTKQSAFEALESLHYLDANDSLEKQFLLDMCILAVWDDHIMDATEFQFLQQLSVTLQLSEEELQDAISSLVIFSQTHAKKIKLFDYTHPVKHFYKQSAGTVKLLILRNKKRLIKELNESGELLILLGQSSIRDLNEEEKQQVRKQLLDVCKTIPSLTIFLLPGGSLLLPLLIKFIPQLLPSAFDENRIEKDSVKD